jgi:DNA primase large subunit
LISPQGIGLSVDEAIVFWRKSFSNVTDDKFNKDYRYNIRHGYGLEGKRMNYPPKSYVHLCIFRDSSSDKTISRHSCQRIITSDAPGPQDSHGCPFRHFSESSLSTALLATYKLSTAEQREVVEAARSGHYHVACTRLFEVTHGIKRGDGLGAGENVSHPNRYFDRSRELERESKGAAPEPVKMEVDG